MLEQSHGVIGSNHMQSQGLITCSHVIGSGVLGHMQSCAYIMCESHDISVIEDWSAS